MCKSQAEGGQRCASHTRARYAKITPAHAAWDLAASEYASTAEGEEVLRGEATRAMNAGDYQHAARLNSALGRGVALREANKEAASRIQAARSDAAEQPDPAAAGAALREANKDAASRIQAVRSDEAEQPDPAPEFLRDSRRRLAAAEEMALGLDIAAGNAARHLLGLPDSERRDYLAALPEEVRARVADPATGEFAAAAEHVDRLLSQRDAARARFIEANLGLLHRVVYEFARHGRRTYGIDDAELTSAAQFELVKAADNWDPTHGGKFSTYASACMRYGMIRACDEHTDTLARIPSRLVAPWRQVRRSHEDARLNSRPFNASDAAEAAATTPENVRALLDVPLRSWARDVHTLDDAALADPGPTAQQIAETAQMQEQVHQLLDLLNEREAGVIALRHGITGEPPLSLDAIAHRYGVTRERIRQIESRAMNRLRHLANPRVGTTASRRLAVSLADFVSAGD